MLLGQEWENNVLIFPHHFLGWVERIENSIVSAVVILCLVVYALLDHLYVKYLALVVVSEHVLNRTFLTELGRSLLFLCVSCKGLLDRIVFLLLSRFIPQILLIV